MAVEVRHVLERLPRYVRLAWELERDARVGRGRKAALILAACYSVSPLDAIPGFLPVVGQLDDLLVLLWGIRHTLDRLPPAVREEHLRRARVTREEVDADYRRVRAAIGTIARGTGRLAGRAAVGMLRLGIRAGYHSLRWTLRAKRGIVLPQSKRNSMKCTGPCISRSLYDCENDKG